MRRRWQRWVLGVGAVLLLLVAVDRLLPADVRPAGMSSQTPEQESRARARLSALRAAHGAKAWDAYRTMELVFSDEWTFAVTRVVLSPWDQPRQKLRGRMVRRTWTTELERLDGEHAGERWGLQSWQTWKAPAGQPPRFDESWWVATTVAGLRYFLELPLPQDTATHVQDAGAAEWEGKTYERLYVTWNQPGPQRDFDQYVLWIDPDSGLVGRVDFTIRAVSGLAVARARFEGQRDFDGVKLAARIVIDAVLPTGHTLPVHTLEVESIEWDSFEPDAIRPDPGLAETGEAKPQRP